MTLPETKLFRAPEPMPKSALLGICPKCDRPGVYSTEDIYHIPYLACGQFCGWSQPIPEKTRTPKEEREYCLALPDAIPKYLKRGNWQWTFRAFDCAWCGTRVEGRLPVNQVTCGKLCGRLYHLDQRRKAAKKSWKLNKKEAQRGNT